MKIIYDTKEDIYLVKVEYPETEIWIKTNDITNARAEFVERMTRAFDDTVCEKFKDDITKYIPTKEENTICQSDFDHEWECCGVSTVDTTYVCKKCHTYKHEPNQIEPKLSIKDCLADPSVMQELIDKIIAYENDFGCKPYQCLKCANFGWDMPECQECRPENNFKYFETRDK